MNWTKVLLAGVAGGIALNLTEWVLHGMILANTYTKYPVFSQEAASPLYFLLIAPARRRSRAHLRRGFRMVE